MGRAQRYVSRNSDTRAQCRGCVPSDLTHTDIFEQFRKRTHDCSLGYDSSSEMLHFVVHESFSKVALLSSHVFHASLDYRQGKRKTHIPDKKHKTYTLGGWGAGVYIVGNNVFFHTLSENLLDFGAAVAPFLCRRAVSA